MKKFVSIVLALALALSLCTVAFADSSKTGGAETKNTVSTKGYKFLKMEDNTDVVDFETAGVKEFDKYVTTKLVETEDDETETTYFADKYVIDTYTCYAVDAGSAEYKLVKGSTFVYLTTDATAASTKEVVAKVVEGEEDTCGKYDFDGDVYVVDDDTAYAEFDEDTTTTAAWVVYKNVFVKVGDAVEKTEHGNDWTVYTKEGGKVTSIKCKNCKEVVAVVEKIPAGSAAEYVKVTLEDDTVVYYVKNAEAAAAETEKTVDSSKTFDAGVAMYVGLSLASVAGSAVVIGKKKEF